MIWDISRIIVVRRLLIPRNLITPQAPPPQNIQDSLPIVEMVNRPDHQCGWSRIMIAGNRPQPSNAITQTNNLSTNNQRCQFSSWRAQSIIWRSQRACSVKPWYSSTCSNLSLWSDMKFLNPDPLNVWLSGTWSLTIANCSSTITPTALVYSITWSKTQDDLWSMSIWVLSPCQIKAIG